MQYSLPENESAMQVLFFLQNRLGLSHNEIKRLKQCGGIKVNNIPVTVRHLLVPGDTISLQKDESRSDIEPVNIPLDIIFEDEHMLVVNKPSRMAVHPSQGNHGHTLAEAVMFYYRDLPFVFRPANRLDKYTSGLVIVAKSAAACSKLCDQFAKKEIVKQYIGITQGIPSPPSGRIELAISRNKDSILKREVNPVGKPSVTEYQMLEQRNHDALVRFWPLTGRTHQIRVHMAAIGHPLKYDFLYGKEVEGKNYLLHCEKLKLSHPLTLRPLEFFCSAPFNNT